MSALNEQYRALVQYLLANAPDGLSSTDRRRIEKYLADDSADPYSHMCLWFGGDRADEVTLAIEVVQVDEEGDEGNLVRKSSIKLGVNWSAYGTIPPEVAAQKLALMTAVTNLAKIASKTFGATVFTEVVKTKAQREAEAKEEAEQQAKKERRRSLVLFLQAEGKGMRVNQTRTANLPHQPDDGCDLVAGNKRFAVTVRGGAVMFTRTS